MSTVDVTAVVVVGGRVDVAGIISSLNSEFGTPRVTSYDATAKNTASTSGASLLALSNVAVELDETVGFFSKAVVSCGTLVDRVGSWHEIDGVTQNNDDIFKQFVGTSVVGDQGSLTNFSFIIDKAAGNYTFDLRWRNMDGARTIYAAKTNLFVLRWKRRAP